MWWKIGNAIVKGYTTLWIAAVGGIVGANGIGLTYALLSWALRLGEPNPAMLQTLMHAGWCGGTALFLFGAISGRMRFINGSIARVRHQKSLSTPSQRDTQETQASDYSSCSSGEQGTGKQQKSDGMLGWMFGGGLVGGLAGLFLGLSLLIFWFSLAYSPFAPREVTSSLKLAEQRRVGANRGLHSDHSVSLYLALAPAAVGVAVGVTAGAVLCLTHQQRRP